VRSLPTRSRTQALVFLIVSTVCLVVCGVGVGVGAVVGLPWQAKHGLDFTWNAMQKKAKRIEKNMKTKS